MCEDFGFVIMLNLEIFKDIFVLSSLVYPVFHRRKSQRIGMVSIIICYNFRHHHVVAIWLQPMKKARLVSGIFRNSVYCLRRIAMIDLNIAVHPSSFLEMLLLLQLGRLILESVFSPWRSLPLRHILAVNNHNQCKKRS